MKAILFTFFLLLALSVSASTNIITATLTVTNVAGTTNGQTITINGDVRTWTNSVVLANTQILTNSTVVGACSNLWLSYVQFPESSKISILRQTTSNVVFYAFPNSPLDVSVSAGWATVALSTNTIAAARTVVAIPYDADSAAEQTNTTSGIVAMVNADASTNKLNFGGYFVRSNSLASWPAAPLVRGDAYIGNSNGYPYILLSTNGAAGSATWTGTNQLGW